MFLFRLVSFFFFCLLPWKSFLWSRRWRKLLLDVMLEGRINLPAKVSERWNIVNAEKRSLTWFFFLSFSHPSVFVSMFSQDFILLRWSVSRVFNSYVTYRSLLLYSVLLVNDASLTRSYCMSLKRSWSCCVLDLVQSCVYYTLKASTCKHIIFVLCRLLLFVYLEVHCLSEVWVCPCIILCIETSLYSTFHRIINTPFYFPFFSLFFAKVLSLFNYLLQLENLSSKNDSNSYVFLQSWLPPSLSSLLSLLLWKFRWVNFFFTSFFMPCPQLSQADLKMRWNYPGPLIYGAYDAIHSP